MSESRSGRTPTGTAYDITGTASEHPPVLLIHGLGLARGLWDDHVALFADRPAIRYDLYGHGESAPCPRPADLALYAEQIVELLDAVAVETVCVVGFSIGGMINRRLALDAPDRIASLVVMSSPHDRGVDGQAAVEQRAASVREEGPLATLEGALGRWFTPAALQDRPDLAARVTEWRHLVEPESYAQAAWVLAHGVRELTDAALPDVPTFVLTGEHDSGSTPEMAQAIARQAAAGPAHIVAGYQHLGLLEDPRAFLGPVIDFVTRTHP